MLSKAIATDIDEITHILEVIVLAVISAALCKAEMIHCILKYQWQHRNLPSIAQTEAFFDYGTIW